MSWEFSSTLYDDIYSVSIGGNDDISYEDNLLKVFPCA